MDEKALKRAIDRYCHLIGEPYNGTRHELVASTITAYLQALSPGSTGSAEGWEDIASAPKDGVVFFG